MVFDVFWITHNFGFDFSVATSVFSAIHPLLTSLEQAATLSRGIQNEVGGKEWRVCLGETHGHRNGI